MTAPEPCDCCHAEDGGWTTLALTRGELADPRLPGATVRLLTHMLGEDGRLHLAEVARGPLAGASAPQEDPDTVNGVALAHDGDDELHWWGPLQTGRHLLQVQR